VYSTFFFHPKNRSVTGTRRRGISLCNSYIVSAGGGCQHLLES
jgi:hypothetical protein